MNRERASSAGSDRACTLLAFRTGRGVASLTLYRAIARKSSSRQTRSFCIRPARDPHFGLRQVTFFNRELEAESRNCDERSDEASGSAWGRRNVLAFLPGAQRPLCLEDAFGFVVQPVDQDRNQIDRLQPAFADRAYVDAGIGIRRDAAAARTLI